MTPEVATAIAPYLPIGFGLAWAVLGYLKDLSDAWVREVLDFTSTRQSRRGTRTSVPRGTVAEKNPL